VLTGELRASYKVKDSVKGVTVTHVEGAAAEKGLSVGDVITEVAQQAVTSDADVMKQVQQLRKDGRTSLLLLVANPEGDQRFVALRLQ
jgi:serine protease Do